MAKDIDVKVDYIQDKVDEVVDVVHRIDKEVCAQKVAFDDHLAQDERMFQEFVRMNNILQQQHDSLKEHMHRSDLLEDIVRSQGERLNPIETKHIKDQIVAEYRQERKMRIKGWFVLAAKIASGVAAIIAIAMTIKTLSGR